MALPGTPGQRISDLCNGNHITQKELAEALHISQTSVSKYETGEAVPDLELIVKMADFFGVSLDEFVNRKKQ